MFTVICRGDDVRAYSAHDKSEESDARFLMFIILINNLVISYVYLIVLCHLFCHSFLFTIILLFSFTFSFFKILKIEI